LNGRFKGELRAWRRAFDRSRHGDYSAGSREKSFEVPIPDRDKEIGRVGHEINFNRYFYKYQPPRKLADIDAELKQVEAEIAALLGEVTEKAGSNPWPPPTSKPRTTLFAS
jgi:hypothetical protein